MYTIFVVDDTSTNLLAAREALESIYRVLTMPSAAKMLTLCEKILPDLILLDIEMPEMDGFAALGKLKADERFGHIPVIFLTGTNNTERELKGFEMGAVDFITKPFSPPVLIKRLEMHLETDKLIKNGQKGLRKMQNAMINVIADMVENRDKVTGGHIDRTQNYLNILVKEMVEAHTYEDEISKWNLGLLIPSAQLHDLGKISVSDIILNKPSKLDEYEYNEIKKHTSEGVRIIDEIMSQVDDDGFLYHAKQFAGYHHEKWNGLGYPYGLKGTDIPLQGRIMAIPDVYDALTTERPYKKAFSHEDALEIIKNDRGTHFDPDIVDVFLKASGRFEAELNKKGGGVRSPS